MNSISQGTKRCLTAALVAAAAVTMAPHVAAAQSEPKVALVAPMSGPWARQGELMKMGAEMAIADINERGGIKALGGAKLKLVIVDAGDNAEKAKNAAQRLVAQEPDVIGGTGAFLSSFTLAVTEVTERAGLPWLTLSYSDQITSRGFKYVFQTSATGSEQANQALPTIMALAKSATGKDLKTVAVIRDNTASSTAFVEPMKAGGFDRLNLKLVTDQVFTPPLSDATPMVQQVRSHRPEVLILTPTNVPDDKLVLEKLNEFGLGKGRLPVVGNGSHLGQPEMLKLVGNEIVDGMLSIVGNWGTRAQSDLIKRFAAKTGEPWMGQESMSTYGDMWVFKEALEVAGSIDRTKVADAIRRMNSTTGAAQYFSGQKLKFSENGRREGASLVIIQWQNGRVETVFPTDAATAPARWPKP